MFEIGQQLRHLVMNDLACYQLRSETIQLYTSEEGAMTKLVNTEQLFSIHHHVDFVYLY